MHCFYLRPLLSCHSLPTSFKIAYHIATAATAALSRLPTDRVRWDQRSLLARTVELLIRGVLLALRFAAAARRFGLSSSRLKPLSASCT